MISILNSNTMPQLLSQLHEWFEQEWGESKRSVDEYALCNVPVPIVAVDVNQSLVGGIAFTSHPTPDSAELGVWINALFVVPCFRGRGIASELVRAAEQEANRQRISQLFVYTNVPLLYQKLGWSLLKQEHVNSVLVKVIAENQT